MSYKKLLENLKALPPEQRILAAERYIYENDQGEEECGCVLGKGLPQLREFFKLRNTKHIDAFLFSRADLEGMTVNEALLVQGENDSFGFRKNDRHIREARYKYMIEWLEQRVGEEK